MEKNTGTFCGLTFRQAVGVIRNATGNSVAVNPFDARSIERAALGFGSDGSVNYPTITPRESGGFIYRTISGRNLEVYPDETGWTLDCSQWWEQSHNFRGTIESCLEEVLQEERYQDASLPEAEPPHCHMSDNKARGQTFGLFEVPPNNHGCGGFSLEVAAISATEGHVLGGASCSSCHQVGHDDARSPVATFKIVRLPLGFCWQCASETDPSSLWARDASGNEWTKVVPRELEVIGDLLLEEE